MPKSKKTIPKRILWYWEHLSAAAFAALTYAKDHKAAQKICGIGRESATKYAGSAARFVEYMSGVWRRETRGDKPKQPKRRQVETKKRLTTKPKKAAKRR